MPRPKTYTLAAMIADYKATSRWRRLADSSVRAYTAAFDAILPLRLINRKALADTSVTAIRPIHAEAIYTHLCDHHALATANLYISVLRSVFSAAMRLELADHNPFTAVMLTPAPSRDVAWSPDKIERFIITSDAHGVGSIGTLALMAYDLCQRPVDCRLMTWSSYRDGLFRFRQQKTGTLIEMDASPALQARLAAIQSNRAPDAAIVQYEVTGAPFSERLYRKKAQWIRSLAGLPTDLKIGDLRRTGATELGEANCTEDQIRAVTGHKSRQVVSTYVKTSLRMATAAQTKRRNNNEVLYG